MTIFEKIEKLKNKIQNLQKELYDYENELKEEFLKKDFIDGLFEYMLYQGYPLETYSSFSSDSGISDSFGKVQIKVCYNYGYTDIVGLTEEEFQQLDKKIIKYYNENY